MDICFLIGVCQTHALRNLSVQKIVMCELGSSNRIFQSKKCPSGESSGGKMFSGEMSGGKMSTRQNILAAKCLAAKYPRGLIS